MPGCGEFDMRRWWRGAASAVFFVVSFFVSVSVAQARSWQGFGPISVRTQNPVYLQTLGLTPQRAEVLAEGTIEIRLDSAYTNLFEREGNANASIDLDMEYWRLAPWITYGLRDDLQVGVEIPLVNFSGGFLDAFIQRFHKTFGLPNGGRESVPNGRFSYRFDAGGQTRFDFPSTALGLGDIVLHFKHQLTGEDSELPAMALFADIKFPTGKASRGWGNGSPDFGFGFALETSWERLHGYVNTMGIATGGNDSFNDFMYGGMFAFAVAGELTLLPSWSLVVQLNGSTPLLGHTGLESWDGVPLDLVVGFKGEEKKLLGGQDFIWQFGFSEDILSSGPSPDFTVFISFGLRFDIFGRSRPAGEWLARNHNQ
ncbi:MAG TPA: DUF3187 family protein [bacterium]|nr:DUF3187 family protein [bacterium]